MKIDMQPNQAAAPSDTWRFDRHIPLAVLLTLIISTKPENDRQCQNRQS